MTMPKPDDVTILLERVHQGDETALAVLVDRHAAILCREARRRLGPALQALLDPADLVQSVQCLLLIAFRRKKLLMSTVDELIALARTMLDRRIAKHWRRIQKQYQNGAAALDETHKAAALAAVISREASPERAVQLRDEIRHLLSLLSPADQHLVKLRLHGASTPEIARRLRVTPGTVRVRLGRVRQRLRKQGYVAE